MFSMYDIIPSLVKIVHHMLNIRISSETLLCNIVLYDLIDWCLTPTLEVFPLYRGKK